MVGAGGGPGIFGMPAAPPLNAAMPFIKVGSFGLVGLTGRPAESGVGAGVPGAASEVGAPAPPIRLESQPPAPPRSLRSILSHLEPLHDRSQPLRRRQADRLGNVDLRRRRCLLLARHHFADRSADGWEIRGLPAGHSTR